MPVAVPGTPQDSDPSIAIISKVAQAQKDVRKPTREEARLLPRINIKIPDGTFVSVSQTDLPDEYWEQLQTNNLAWEAVLRAEETKTSVLECFDMAK